MSDEPRSRAGGAPRPPRNDPRQEIDDAEPPSDTGAMRAKRVDPRVDDEAPAPAIPRAPAVEARPPPAVIAPVDSTARPEMATLQRQLGEAEGRASAAEGKLSDLTAAHGIARKLHDDLKETLEAERQMHARKLAALEGEHAAALEKREAEHARAIEELKKDFDEAKANLSAPAARKSRPPAEAALEAAPETSAEAKARSPKYYGAPNIPIVAAPAEAPRPNKRVMRIAAQGLVFVILAVAAYQHRDGMRRAVSPIVDMPKITGTREEVGRIVDALSKEETIHGLPAPDELSAFLRENSQSKQGDPSKDLWETPFRLEVTPTSYTVRSAGPDREYETDDDIVLEHPRAAK